MSETPSNITWSAILNYFRAERKSLVANDPAEIKTLYESNANTNAFTDDDVTDLGNSFDKTTDTLDDITSGTTNKHFTDTEKTKLGTIDTNADVTAAELGAAIFNSTEEANPDDNDRFSLSNGADAESRYSLWSQIKATLKTYFDGLYAALNGSISNSFSSSDLTVSKCKIFTKTASNSDISAAIEFDTSGSGLYFPFAVEILVSRANNSSPRGCSSIIVFGMERLGVLFTLTSTVIGSAESAVPITLSSSGPSLTIDLDVSAGTSRAVALFKVISFNNIISFT